jgi:hypothetical protein
MTLGTNWGATDRERAMEMACDRLLPEAPVRLHRAVSVRAPAPVVFRWLCQLRLAPYSYDLIDNLGRTSPRELTPGLDRLEVGQRFMTIFSLVAFVPGEHITLRSRRVAVTYAVIRHDGPTRVIARVLFDPPGGHLAARLAGRAVAWGDLVMMRKQLLTLAALAERDAAEAGSSRSGSSADSG